jgi:hypothetical protein
MATFITAGGPMSRQSNHERRLPKLSESTGSLKPRKALKPLAGQADLFDLTSPDGSKRKLKLNEN